MAEVFLKPHEKTFVVILIVELSQLKPGKTLKKSKILLIFADVNKSFAFFFFAFTVDRYSNFLLTFLLSLSYFTPVFKILRPYMSDLSISENVWSAELLVCKIHKKKKNQNG